MKPRIRWSAQQASAAATAKADVVHVAFEKEETAASEAAAAEVVADEQVQAAAHLEVEREQEYVHDLEESVGDDAELSAQLQEEKERLAADLLTRCDGARRSALASDT